MIFQNGWHILPIIVSKESRYHPLLLKIHFKEFWFLFNPKGLWYCRRGGVSLGFLDANLTKCGFFFPFFSYSYYVCFLLKKTYCTSSLINLSFVASFGSRRNLKAKLIRLSSGMELLTPLRNFLALRFRFAI